MTRKHVCFAVTFGIVFGYASPSRADAVFAAGFGTSDIFTCPTIQGTVMLNSEETHITVTARCVSGSPPPGNPAVSFQSMSIIEPPEGGLPPLGGAPRYVLHLGRGVTDLLAPISADDVIKLKAGLLHLAAVIVVNPPGPPEFFFVTKRLELQTPATSTYTLAEGATGTFFDTDVIIANPNAVPASAQMSFLRDDGAVVDHQVELPAYARRTVSVDAIAGLEAAAMSTTVRSSVPLLVERTMRWGGTTYGAHSEKAFSNPHPFWFFAEGAQGFFRTYLLLVNPNPDRNQALVRFLIDGMPPVVRRVDTEPRSRVTLDLATIPELEHRSFGMDIAFARPGMAERAMYFGSTPLFAGGHASAGANAPAKHWFLAEGATGSLFETFVLIANPSPTVAAQVRLRYYTTDGVVVTRTHSVPPSGRATINLEAEGDPALQHASVATEITASVPVIVERAQYWPDPATQWYEGHSSVAADSLGQGWGLAEGRVGGPEQYQTFILLANPGTIDATASLQFLREDGGPIEHEVLVPAHSRVTVATGPGTSVPELSDARFGVVVRSIQPLVVERSMYWSPNGVLWAAGTNTLGVRLQ
jgi:hypothetical protein